VGHFLDYSQFVTADGADLYVYNSGVGCGDEIFVCSPVRLNKRQVARAAKVAMENHKETEIAEELKVGTSPAKVWNDYGHSAADIGRIAKKHGIKLPRNWFSSALSDMSLSRNQGRL